MTIIVDYIECDALADLLLTNSSEVAVIDVRDEDFDGGHIKGAINFTSDQFQDHHELDELIDGLKGKDKVVVHCMFSQQRGPRGALKLAERLQQLKRLDFNVMVLRGGFRRFVALYGSNPNLCEDVDVHTW